MSSGNEKLSNLRDRYLFMAHGFGAGPDADGLSDVIADVLPDHELKMASFYKRREGGHPRDLDMMIADEQAELLRRLMKKVEGERIAAAHSMGSVALALAILSYDDVRVDRAILFAPALDDNEDNIMQKISDYGGTPNPGDMSTIPRDGEGNIFVPHSYFTNLRQFNLPSIYERVAAIVPTIIVRALGDSIVNPEAVANIHGAHHIAIDGDHNFKGEARLQLKHELTEALGTLR